MKVVPPGGYSTFPQPPGLSTALVDPTTGMLATAAAYGVHRARYGAAR